MADQISISLDARLLERIEEMSERTGFSRSSLCEALIKLALDRFSPAELGAAIFTSTTSSSTTTSKRTSEPSSKRG